MADKVLAEIRVRIRDEKTALLLSNFQHINWSEFCRLAIRNYMGKNPKPLNKLFKEFNPSIEKITFQETQNEKQD